MTTGMPGDFPSEARPVVVLHLPHASTVMPDLDGFVGNWRQEIDLLTDWATEDIFDVKGAERVIAACSRVYCDVERYADDALEPMARLGMGAVYTHADDGAILRHVDAGMRARIIATWHRPHHQRLSHVVCNLLKQGRPVVLIDGHSFSDLPFRRDDDQRRPRPDICLGTDRTWSAPAATERMRSAAAEQGFSVSINAPYGGAMVPEGVPDLDPTCQARFKSYMIELNRRLYLRGAMAVPTQVTRMRELVRSMVEAIFHP